MTEVFLDRLGASGPLDGFGRLTALKTFWLANNNFSGDGES